MGTSNPTATIVRSGTVYGRDKLVKNLCARLFIATTFSLLASISSAQQQLSGDDIARLVTGKSVEIVVHVQNDARNTLYFSKDGNALSRSEGGRVTNGKWRISDDGLHCTQWGSRPETCAQIVKQPDGSFKRIEGGAIRATWRRIVDGKSFD